MNALQPYLVPDFCASIQKDCQTIYYGMHDLDKNTGLNIDKFHGQHTVTKMALAGVRLFKDCILLLHGFIILERTVRIIANPAKFVDAPIFPMIGLAYGITVYLLSHDIIRIANQYENCLPKLPGQKEAQQANKSIWGVITAVSNLVLSNAGAVIHSTAQSVNKYHVVRDTFYYPLWCIAIDGMHEAAAGPNQV